MRKHLLAVWDEIEPRLKERPVTLFLDYDGTLTPIVQHPALARLSARNKKLLREISRLEGVRVAILSGRRLKDLRRLVGLSHMIYAGNHGLELEGPGLHYIHPSALEARPVLRRAAERLQKALRSFKGVLIENKIFTVSVHYRRLAETEVERAREKFLGAVKDYLDSSRLTFTEGKKVWELRPVTSWNKGMAALWLFSRGKKPEGSTLMVMGDDRTDEDAFRAISLRGIGIRVTKNPGEPSLAPYTLRSSGEVFRFLRRLKGIRTTGRQIRGRN